MPEARKILNIDIITEMKVNEWGLYYTLKMASPFKIIKEHDEYMEVEGEVHEMEDYFGVNNPEIEYISEFKHIKRYK